MFAMTKPIEISKKLKKNYELVKIKIEPDKKK